MGSLDLSGYFDRSRYREKDGPSHGELDLVLSVLSGIGKRPTGIVMGERYLAAYREQFDSMSLTEFFELASPDRLAPQQWTGPVAIAIERGGINPSQFTIEFEDAL